jgi:hypothetical protein
MSRNAIQASVISWFRNDIRNRLNGNMDTDVDKKSGRPDEMPLTAGPFIVAILVFENELGCTFSYRDCVYSKGIRLTVPRVAK